MGKKTKAVNNKQSSGIDFIRVKKKAGHVDGARHVNLHTHSPPRARAHLTASRMSQRRCPVPVPVPASHQHPASMAVARAPAAAAAAAAAVGGGCGWCTS
jgi:hypothetical protein